MKLHSRGHSRERGNPALPREGMVYSPSPYEGFALAYAVAATPGWPGLPAWAAALLDAEFLQLVTQGPERDAQFFGGCGAIPAALFKRALDDGAFDAGEVVFEVGDR